MSGASITYEVRDDAAQRAFGDLARVVKNTTPVMKAIGTGLVEGTHTRFERAVDPDGAAWTPLNPDYAVLKRGPGILRESAMRGGLMGSITQRAGADSVEVGTNKEYAAAHQFGAVIKAKGGGRLAFRMKGGLARPLSVTIPAREFLGLSAEDDRVILETLIDALDRAIARNAASRAP